MPVVSMRIKPPILDMTALLVLHDLELLDQLFDFFPRIAIAQSTLSELAGMTNPMSGSPWLSKCIALQGFLKTKMQQILQPRAPAAIDDGVDNSPFGRSSKDIKDISKSGEFQLYSDDAIFRLYCSGSDGALGRVHA